MMLQGKSKIELFDAITGKKTFEHEEHNMITNAYKKAYETIMSKIILTDDFSYMNKLYPRDFSRSILLLANTQTADANNFVPKGTLTGYASENGYSGSSSMRGTFNSVESVPLSNPSGYKYVWDFPTNCANGVISSLVLTPSITTTNVAQNITNLINSPTKYIAGVFSDETGDNFYNFYSSAGVYGFTKSTLKSTIPYLSSTGRFTTVIYTFPSYSSGMSNIVYYGGYVYLILKLTSDSKWYLVKSDTSGNIVSTTLIGTTPPTGNYFGIVGNYAVWYNTRTGTTVYLKVFNIVTGTFASDIVITGLINYYTADTFYNIGTSLMVGNTNGSSGYETLIDENLNVMKVADDQYVFPFAGYSNAGNYIGNAPMIFNGTSIYVAPFTMFTINNLATPVTKTNANTMKISYSLNWS